MRDHALRPSVSSQLVSNHKELPFAINRTEFNHVSGTHIALGRGVEQFIEYVLCSFGRKWQLLLYNSVQSRFQDVAAASQGSEIRFASTSYSVIGIDLGFVCDS